MFFQVHCCAFCCFRTEMDLSLCWLTVPEFLFCSFVCVSKSGENALLRNSFGIWHGIHWGREVENESMKKTLRIISDLNSTAELICFFWGGLGGCFSLNLFNSSLGIYAGIVFFLLQAKLQLDRFRVIPA